MSKTFSKTFWLESTFNPFPVTFSVKVMGAHPDTIPVPSEASEGLHHELLDLRRPDLDETAPTWRARVTRSVPTDFIVIELVTFLSERFQVRVPGQVSRAAIQLVTASTYCK